MASSVGRRIDALVAQYTDVSLPDSERLPRFVAPLPRWLENVGLRLALPIAFVNLLGTAFGFWYYRFQLFDAPLAAWPLIPDSPLATLFIGLSLIAWRLDWDVEWLHVLAFFGCLKLGLWTPYVQLFLNGPAGLASWLYVFLIVSHLAMAVEAFVIHRYASFPVGAILLATGWYAFNDLVDYFWPLFDGPHHTVLRAEYVDGVLTHAVPAHDFAAAAAVLLTLSAVVLAFLTRIEKNRHERAGC